MSAWIVSQNHVRALVTGAVKFGVVKASDAEMFGKVLTLANKISVDYRYNESNEVEEYTHEDVELDPVVLLKQVRCYDYQSCEHPSWDASETKRLCDDLEEKIRASLPSPYAQDTEEYRRAPWGV